MDCLKQICEMRNFKEMFYTKRNLKKMFYTKNIDYFMRNFSCTMVVSGFCIV